MSRPAIRHPDVEVWMAPLGDRRARVDWVEVDGVPWPVSALDVDGLDPGDVATVTITVAPRSLTIHPPVRDAS